NLQGKKAASFEIHVRLYHQRNPVGFLLSAIKPPPSKPILFFTAVDVPSQFFLRFPAGHHSR
ncbi:MAG: hypothetical protein AAGU05_12540, partial [Anaerolineaceae bacterium]